MQTMVKIGLLLFQHLVTLHKGEKYASTPASFPFIFGLFKHNYNFYTKNMGKMDRLGRQHPVLGFKLTTS